MARAKKCKTVTVCGRRRRICWSAKGKIVSNSPAGSRRGRKSSGGRKRSGSKFGLKRNGKLKKGCRFRKGGRVVCKKR